MSGCTLESLVEALGKKLDAQFVSHINMPGGRSQEFIFLKNIGIFQKTSVFNMQQSLGTTGIAQS